MDDGLRLDVVLGHPAAAEVEGRDVVVGAVILNDHGRVLTLRRSATSKMLPGLWDLVGGHVESGETLLEALRREVVEETGWTIVGDPLLLYVGDWDAHEGTRTRSHREFDFVVNVEDHRTGPRLRGDEHSESRWVGEHDLDLFDENRDRDGGLVRRVVAAGLRCARPGILSFPHSTVFLPSELAATIDQWRVQWDPAMAAQIAPHVTVAYPHQVHGVADMQTRVARAARQVGPFELRVGPLAGPDATDGWVGLCLEDVDGGWQALRERIMHTDARAQEDIAPHITLVHPRTSGLARQAAGSLPTGPLHGLEFRVRSVSVTAFDGRRWTRADVALQG